MRILKYLFLLFLLSLFALLIFVATLKGDFTLERSKVINSPKTLVYSYLNDNNNWKSWNSWAVEDPGITITNSPNTIGQGSSFSWNGKEGEGEIKTIQLKENESIVQKMNYNGTISDVNFAFKDTIGGTKVIWKTSGYMNFSYKILTLFSGGIKGILGNMLEKSLENLNKKLVFEINTYSAKVEGEISMPKSFYLAQTFTSEISKVDKNSEIVFPKIINYCNKNNITTNGKPFIIYHTYDTIHNLSKVSICIPIKDSISTATGSNILFNKTQAYQAVKTTLSGNYSHRINALAKTKEYLTKNNIRKDNLYSFIEIRKQGTADTKNPSKWITEIIIPVKPIVILKNQ